MSEKIRVATEDEFADPDRKVVEADGTSIGVFKYDDEYHAIQNECSHQGGPVCKGQVRPELVAEYTGPGEQIEEDYAGEPIIACPWHGYTYYLKTGEHIGSGEFDLKLYDVVIEDGVVYVEP